MKRNLKLLILLLLLFAYRDANAASACSYKEQADLNSEAAKIKVKYEGKVGELERSTYTCEGGGEDCVATYNYFTITILNMSENFYIDVSNNVTRDRATYYYSDVKDGVITFDYDKAESITNFTFKVYSSAKTNCSGENYRVIYFTTPKVNPYYDYLLCDNNPEYYLCQKYITTEEVSFEQFQSQVLSYEKQKNGGASNNEHRGFLEKIYDFIDDHKPLLIITTLLIVGGVATVVIVKKRKESL